MNKKGLGKGIGIFLIIILIAIFVVLLILAFKPAKEVSNDFDFEIISTSWNTYIMEWGDNGLQTRIPKTEIIWDDFCDNCHNKGEPCYWGGGWHLNVKASEKLKCSNIIDGIRSNDEGGRSLISDGLTKVTFVESTDDEIYTNFDFTKEHEIIVCCTPYDDWKRNSKEICDEVILKAKC